MIFSFDLYISQANWRETFPATSGPTAPAFAFSAPVLHFVFATARPSSFQQTLPLQRLTIPAALLSHRDRPNVSQHQGAASNFVLLPTAQ